LRRRRTNRAFDSGAFLSLDRSGETIDHAGFRLEGYSKYREKLDALDIHYSTMDLPELNERRLFVRTPAGILLELVLGERRVGVIRVVMGTSGVVQVFGRRHDEPFHALWRSASKKRQGTKSWEVGHRRCCGAMEI
jgi:hypothetical protein